MTTLRERVERGAALLDKVRRSKVWREEIDAEKLDIDSCVQCMLGQLYGNYRTGLIRLDLYGSMTISDFGFLSTSDDPQPLTRAWRKYLAEARP